MEGKYISDMPLVSIGVPVYNGEKYLIECLDSIINQTYPNWECIIVDNCSTDNTPAILQSYKHKYPKMKMFRNNVFLTAMQNWNETFKHVSPETKYFKIIPADDWIFPEFLQEMVDLMELHPDVGICSSYRIDGNTIRGNGINYYDGNVIDGQKIIAGELTQKFDLTGSGNSVLYRNDALKKLSHYPSIFNESSIHIDTELAYELMFLMSFGFVFKVLSYTRRHESSISSSFVYRLNTPLCFTDNQMIKYADIIPDFKKNYKKLRIKYAHVYKIKYLTRDKKWLDWHRKNLNNKMKLTEIIVYILFNNRITKTFSNKHRNSLGAKLS
jgi:glycosyltransferase involved in cell wall biosynthesis